MLSAIAISVAILASIAEWLHFGRSRRVLHLAFADPRSAAVWMACAGLLRVLAVTLIATTIPALWSSSTVIVNSAGAIAKEAELDRLIIILDCSKSMNIRDAGPDGKETRATRARNVIFNIYKEIGRVPSTTIFAFSDSAVPIVYDAKRWDVIQSVIRKASYSDAFDKENTSVESAIQTAFFCTRDWIEGSTTVLLITDGDSPVYSQDYEIPTSVRNFLVLGVGSVDGRAAGRQLSQQSRQEKEKLASLAAIADGEYFDANEQEIELADKYRFFPAPPEAIPSQTEVSSSLAMFGVGCVILVALPLLLRLFVKAL